MIFDTRQFKLSPNKSWTQGTAVAASTGANEYPFSVLKKADPSRAQPT